MKEALSARLNIFLSVDQTSVNRYYNPHDPAPLYNRQLSHEFKEYLASSLAPAHSNSIIRFKLICEKESDQKFVQPILLSIQRHFTLKRIIKEQAFNNFKRGNYTLLFISFFLIVLLQGIYPFFFGQAYREHYWISSALNVFSWVNMWKPVERLVFQRNSFLEEIKRIKKMESSESIVVINDKEYTVDIWLTDAA